MQTVGFVDTEDGRALCFADKMLCVERSRLEEYSSLKEQKASIPSVFGLSNQYYDVVTVSDTEFVEVPHDLNPYRGQKRTVSILGQINNRVFQGKIFCICVSFVAIWKKFDGCWIFITLTNIR